jgi:hypothetical protein
LKGLWAHREGDGGDRNRISIDYAIQIQVEIGLFEQNQIRMAVLLTKSTFHVAE